MHFIVLNTLNQKLNYYIRHIPTSSCIYNKNVHRYYNSVSMSRTKHYSDVLVIPGPHISLEFHSPALQLHVAYRNASGNYST